jgi:hypothetical protein
MKRLGICLTLLGLVLSGDRSPHRTAEQVLVNVDRTPFNPIDSLRRTDWTTAGVEGGIPTASWSTCTTSACNTVSEGTVTSSSLNSAVSGAPANTIVSIPSGSFTLESSIIIDRSNVAIRGQGADKTKLVFTGGLASGRCGLGNGFMNAVISVCAGGDNLIITGGARHTAPWTAGYSRGTTRITLDCSPCSSAGLEQNGIIILDQADDTVSDGVTDGHPGAGDILNCKSTSPCSGDGGGTYSRSGRTHAEVHRVVSVSGSDVTITPPIYSPDFRSAKSPGAWWGNYSRAPIDILHDVGIERMSIDMTALGHNTSAGEFLNVRNFWFTQNRVVINTSANAFFLPVYPVQSVFGEVSHNYFYGAPTPNSNNTNYTITPHLTTALLMQNNIFHATPSGFAPNDPDVGSVYAYSVAEDVWFEPAAQLHDSGMIYALFEGNQIGGFYSDDNHGRHHFVTLFRNHFDGSNRRNAHRGAVDILAGGRFFNIVGNVMGSSDFERYCRNSGGTGGCASGVDSFADEIYTLGPHGNCSKCGGMPNDVNVARTLFRWGNWDNVTSWNDNGSNDTTGINWDNREVPDGIANFPNMIPNRRDLPVSLYLTRKPAWFQGVAWPPIGPDVSRGNVTRKTGGHANKIPAKVCFDSLSDDPDTAYASSSPRIKSFNASTCYGLWQVAEKPATRSLK